MDAIVSAIFAHPFQDIEIFLSLWAAFGTLAFFWGFFGYFLSHGHIEHQDHARAYMVWGIVLTGSVILVWEGIQFLAGVFSGTSYNGAGLLFGIIDIVLCILFIVSFFIAKPKTGH